MKAWPPAWTALSLASMLLSSEINSNGREERTSSISPNNCICLLFKLSKLAMMQQVLS